MRFAIATIVIAVTGSAAFVGAQESTHSQIAIVPALRTANVRPVSPVLERRDLTPRATIRTSPATVSGAPRDFRVISIAVPDAAPRDRDLDFETESAEDAPVIGSTSGVIRAGIERSRPVRLTIGIPARARAGTSQIALVRFTTREPPGTSPLVIEVPVHLLVQPVQRIELNLLQPSLAARPGQRILIPVRIYNAGNASDDVRLRADAPAGWQAEFGGTDARVELPVHGYVDRNVQVKVPLLANGGSWIVRIVAMRGGDVAAEKSATVTVMNGAMNLAQHGARLTIGSAAAGGPWDGIASAYSLGIDGQLSDDITVSGRAVRSAPQSDASRFGLGRTGYLTGPPSLAMSSSHWRFNAGPQGVGFSELTGVNGATVGLSGAVIAEHWSTSVLAGRPITGDAAGAGMMAGASVSRTVGIGSVGLSATHLSDRGTGYFGARALDAAGVSAFISLPHSIIAKNEVAVRRWASGTGLGVSTSLAQQSRRGSFELTFLEAPGGSDAYARASSQLSGSVTRQLATRVGAHLAGWKTKDNSASFSGIESRGATLGTTVALTRSTRLGVEARHYGFGATSAPVRFGSDETALTTRLEWSSLPVRLAGAATRGALTRTTGIVNGIALVERAPRSLYSAEATFNTSRGALRLQGSEETNGAGVGLPQHRRQYGAGVDRIAMVTFASVQLWASGDFQHMDFGAQQRSVDLIRGGLRMETKSGFNAVVDMERNPFYAAAFASRSSTVWSVRVEQPFQLRRLGANVARGVAYRDLNGNGRRDDLEPTLNGMSVRQGSETTVTDERGRFRFAVREAGVPSLDARSLPLGSVEGKVSQRARHEYDLAVTTLAPVSVQLFIANADSARIPRSMLGAALLVARDSAGVAWVARTIDGGMLLFDGLPPGRYTLSLDLSDIAELLKPESELPVLTVASDVAPTTLRIGLRTRVLRIRPSSQSGNSAAGSTPTGNRPEPNEQKASSQQRTPKQPDRQDLPQQMPKQNPGPTPPSDLP